MFSKTHFTFLFVLFVAILTLAPLVKSCKIQVKAQSQTQIPFKLKILLPHANFEAEECYFTKPSQKNVLVSYQICIFR